MNAFILKVVFGRYSEVRSEQQSDDVEMLLHLPNIVKLNSDVVEIRP